MPAAATFPPAAIVPLRVPLLLHGDTLVHAITIAQPQPEHVDQLDGRDIFKDGTTARRVPEDLDHQKLWDWLAVLTGYPKEFLELVSMADGQELVRELIRLLAKPLKQLN